MIKRDKTRENGKIIWLKYVFRLLKLGVIEIFPSDLKLYYRMHL